MIKRSESDKISAKVDESSCSILTAQFRTACCGRKRNIVDKNGDKIQTFLDCEFSFLVARIFASLFSLMDFSAKAAYGGKATFAGSLNQ